MRPEPCCCTLQKLQMPCITQSMRGFHNIFQKHSLLPANAKKPAGGPQSRFYSLMGSKVVHSYKETPSLYHLNENQAYAGSYEAVKLQPLSGMQVPEWSFLN